jgi:hypothetical protein
LQNLPDAGVRVVQIGSKIHNDLCIGCMTVVDIRVPIVMLIDAHAGNVIMAAVNVNVLMFGASDMSMRMAQRRQHEADTHNEAEHAQQRRHRAGV